MGGLILKFYILMLDEIIKTFSVIGSGVDARFSFTYKDNHNVFQGASNGDAVIGYVDSPVNRYCYVFTIRDKRSNQECDLQKQLETMKGISESEAPDTVKELVSANKGKSLFLEITEDDFNGLLEAMLAKSERELRHTSAGNFREITYETGLQADFPRNRIVFGAPGTGKSNRLEKDRDMLLGADVSDYERVTFHPDYSYGAFAGTYKPVMAKDESGKETIVYRYVPGPFMRVLVKALKNSRSGSPKPFLLIIEEINRANAAAVFGDLFQLLDRKNNYSEYAIQTSEDMRQYLRMELECECEKLRIPDNMFIWATMNSADQGVCPLDTAFKRRWNFEYIGVDAEEADDMGNTNVPGIFRTPGGKEIEWNAMRKAINELLSSDAVKVHEDKLLGPFFLNAKNYLKEGSSDELSDNFCKIVESKVLMYLFEDAAKTKRPYVFEGKANTNRFSVLCREFEINGLSIFAKIGTQEFEEVYNQYRTGSDAGE